VFEVRVRLADPHHVDAEQDPGPDPACHFDADPDTDPTLHFDADPDPSFQIKAQNLEKVLKKSHIPYILARHLQIYADPDSAYHFDAEPDPIPAYH
jgi:hypothetical protein